MSRPFRSRPRRWWLALGWLLALLFAALLAPVLPLPYAPDTTDLTAIAEAPLTGSHWLGTDPLGRDLLAGLLFGARTALLVSLPAAALATLLGGLIGGIAGFWGNTGLRLPLSYAAAAAGTGLFLLGFHGSPTIVWAGASAVAAGLAGGVALLGRRGYRRTVAVPFDALALALMALLASIPLLVLVLALAALYPPSWPGLLAVLVLTYWPGPARLVRAEILRIRALPYIESGWALGLPAVRILWRHALPNCWHTLSATFPLSVATLIGLETTLSFLGVGLPPETASWGRLLAAARLAPTAWWLVLGPAAAIIGTTVALRQLAVREPAH
ncbi:peptide/nickel transport system permease protein [Hymenobacter daecheongensis DSM 21074]|uniref:Peptide/nickel transport system permease protein n=1 Tax=Hymenobacter daecheongensis DSM 21074 TaxID=1121955 RepID=A0A1M6CWT2_9BACT|nr:ABC transporter permease [Hymenobacter daecheongensis]SHI65419.1 peptide/nickel transport system permease protein [Hymenobacter daecheongensis DSM 21074]